MDNSIINIVMTTDNNYAKITATSIASIIYRNQEEKFNFIIVIDNVADKNKKLIENVVKKSVDSKLSFVPFERILQKYPLDKIIKHDIGWPLNTFTCLFLSEITEAERIIYVDDDTICMHSIKNLWDMCFERGKIVAGCLDTYSQTEESKNYINVGILLIDLKKWREELCSEKAYSYIAECKGRVEFADQGVLNALFKDLLQVISPKYNVITPVFMLSRKKIVRYWRMKNYYSEKDLQEARISPIFIHFTRFITVRPWEINCKHPYVKDFEKMWEYAELGELKKTQYEFPSETKKIYDILYRCPWFIFAFYRYGKIAINVVKRNIHKIHKES